jgi:hypothetical protein
MFGLCLFLSFALNLFSFSFLAEALSNLTLNDLLNGFQTTSETLIGLEDRLYLLHYLGDLLSKRPDYFGGEQGGIPRPGNMIGNK